MALRKDRDDRGVVKVTLDRPEIRNAFDEEMIGELHAAADELAADPSARVVVLTGAGAAFSAGADLSWMRSMRSYTREQNAADSARLAEMFRAWWDLPKPVIGRINGIAMGGGVGLVAVCDVAVAAASAQFAFSEVRLGIAPAVISPFVVRKIGLTHARALFVTGDRFDAQRAASIGLVHEVVADAQLDAAVAAVVSGCLEVGPLAVGAAKRLPELALGPLDEVAPLVAAVIAELRVSEEGQEGMAAFFDRRRPSWASDSG